jgi:SAM-dependent methyltransferase
MPAPHQLFDRTLYRQRRTRSSALFTQHNFLHLAAEERLLERLETINRNFDYTLIIGAAGNRLAQHPRLKRIVYADITAARLPCVQNATGVNQTKYDDFQYNKAIHSAHIANTHHESHIKATVAPLQQPATGTNKQHSVLTASCVMDEEWLAFQDDSLDAIISVLHMHHVNDVAGVLMQMQRALKPDGLMLVVTYGARTLMELREAFARAEPLLYGGISPRISPFLEVRDAGALLQRASFALPVADSEMLNISYPSLTALYQELRGMGETNILHDRSRNPMTRSFLTATEAAYRTEHQDAEGRLPCSVEMVFLTGWKPHASQQQPAKRGSGRVSLHDIFGYD